MKAAVLNRIGKPLTIAEVGLTSLQYGQVLVRVLCSGICGAQLQEIAGHKGNAKYVPHLLGHEGCGIVEEIGPAVTRVNVGDKVVMHWRKGGGIESPLPLYQYPARSPADSNPGDFIESGRVTTFNEKSICSENRLTKVPDATPPELCALMGCGLSTALSTIEHEAQLKFGERILIVGCGGLGINLIHAAVLANAGFIAAMDFYASKEGLAREMGADDFIVSEQVSEWVSESEKFDVIIDTSGSVQAISATLPMLADSGRYILVGHPAPDHLLAITNADHLFGGSGKMIKATQGGGFRPDEHLARYLRLNDVGVLRWKEIITHRFKLDDINEALALVRNGGASRVLIQMVDG